VTEPDEYLGRALQRAMSEATACVQPSADGLRQIRARIAGRPPRPWLVSLAVGLAERIRYWTWRGHWARPQAPFATVRPRRTQQAAGRSRPAHRRRSEPQWGFTGLRLAGVLAGIAVVVGVSMGVQPFRQAIIQVSSTMLDGGSNAKAGDAGTDGSGAQAAQPDGTRARGASPTSSARGKHGPSSPSGAAVPGASGSAASASCVPVTQPASGSATADGSPTSAATGTDAPAATADTGTQPPGKGLVEVYCPAPAASGASGATPADSAPDTTYSGGYYSWSYGPADPPTLPPSSADWYPYWQWEPPTYAPAPAATPAPTSTPTPADSESASNALPPPYRSPASGSGGAGGADGGGRRR
jgi:hypothetical protein